MYYDIIYINKEVDTRKYKKKGKWEEKWKEKIPDNYYCQVLHYLNVTNYSFAILKAQLKYDYSGEIRLETKHYTILRKDVEEDIKLLREKEIEFWTKYVEKDIQPPLVLPNF